MTRPALAFDLDGTLVDSLADLTSALNLCFAERAPEKSGSIHFEKSVVRGMIGHGARHLVARALAHTSGNSPKDVQVDDMLVSFRDAYARVFLQETKPFPGIPELLQQLVDTDWTLCVTTNKPAALAQDIVQALLPGFFSCVLGPEDAGAHKPEPAILRVAESRLGVPLLGLVGDSIIDIDTAARAGIPAIAVLWGLGDEGELHGAHVRRASTADELLQLIRSLELSS